MSFTRLIGFAGSLIGVLVLQVIPLHAASTKDSQIEISAPSSVNMNSGGCSNFYVQYKILSKSRNAPGLIGVGLHKKPDFADVFSESAYAYGVIEYNIDTYDFTWDPRNDNSSGFIELQFCDTDSESKTGAPLVALKSGGTYFIFAYAKFNLTKYPKPTDLSQSYLSMPIKIVSKIVKSKILCRKGNVTKTFTGTNVKCPNGWKEKNK